MRSTSRCFCVIRFSVRNVGVVIAIELPASSVVADPAILLNDSDLDSRIAVSSFARENLERLGDNLGALFFVCPDFERRFLAYVVRSGESGWLYGWAGAFGAVVVVLPCSTLLTFLVFAMLSLSV